MSASSFERGGNQSYSDRAKDLSTASPMRALPPPRRALLFCVETISEQIAITRLVNPARVAFRRAGVESDPAPAQT